MLQSPPDPKAPPADHTLIIHLLADPHHAMVSGRQNAFERYDAYLNRLDNKHYPHLLLVAGDVTLVGTTNELREARIQLDNIRRQMENRQIGSRVAVVPGPHDVDWLANNPTDLFDPFQKEFNLFDIPLLRNRAGDPLGAKPYYVQSAMHHYLLYLFNTVITPETLAKMGNKTPQETARRTAIENHIKMYRTAWKDCEKFAGRSGLNASYEEAIRQQMNTRLLELIGQDHGMLNLEDIRRFNTNMQDIQRDELAQSQPGVVIKPLRIVLTHHPLTGFIGQNGIPFGGTDNGNALLRELRTFGYHLALHGHTHQAHTLSDVPLDLATGNEEPALLQVGAPSLAGPNYTNGAFTEIVARYYNTTKQWTAETRMVYLEEEAVRPRLVFALSTPPAVPPAPANPVAPVTVNRVDFDRNLQIAFEHFANDINQSMAMDIPVGPLRVIEETIRDVIFKGLQIRMSLSLKQIFGTTGHRVGESSIYVLQNRYIEPGSAIDKQYVHPFSYPDTIAAWALILGEPLTFPLSDPNGLMDFGLLENSHKLEKVLELLKIKADLNNNESLRARDLYTKLRAKRMIRSEMFYPKPTGVPASRYTSFVSVPVPLRPEMAMVSLLPEIGTLNIDVIDPEGTKPGDAFTEERMDLLRTVSFVIASILLTAHNLQRPTGTWDTWNR